MQQSTIHPTVKTVDFLGTHFVNTPFKTNYGEARRTCMQISFTLKHPKTSRYKDSVISNKNIVTVKFCF
jgi:hypothetical protein